MYWNTNKTFEHSRYLLADGESHTGEFITSMSSCLSYQCNFNKAACIWYVIEIEGCLYYASSKCLDISKQYLSLLLYGVLLECTA